MSFFYLEICLDTIRMDDLLFVKEPRDKSSSFPLRPIILEGCLSRLPTIRESLVLSTFSKRRFYVISNGPQRFDSSSFKRVRNINELSKFGFS